MISKQAIRSFILLLIFSTCVLAQQKQDATPQTEEQRKAQKEVERKALLLLDDVIKEGDVFKHSENRIRIKAASAYLLWNYDEARARILFKDAMASLVDLLREQENADQVDRAKLLQSPKELRGEMLRMVAMHDARLAREFLHATRATVTQPGDDKQSDCALCLMDEADFQTELQLATQIAASDPKLAVEIAEESLQKGFAYQLSGVLSAIREKDPEAAAKLASDIMTKLRTEKLSSGSEGKQVAVELLRLASSETTENDAKAGAKNATPLLDQSALRELTEMVAAEALRGPGNEDMLSSLQAIMPAVEKYAPARAAQIRQKIPKTTVSEEGEESEAQEAVAEAGKYQPLFEKGSTDELLTAAAKAPQGIKEALYQRAAAKMIEDGDMEHARQLVNEKVKDAEQRKAMLELIDKAVSVSAAEQGKIEQVRKMLATLRTNEERAMLLAQLAMGAGAKGDKKVALKLLDEASGMINQRAKNINQLGAQLMVAHAYIQLDPSRSFAILEPIVDQLNELLGAAAVLGGFFVEELVQDDEIMLGPIMSFLNLAGGEFVQYLGDFALLARADFERTKALVDKFQRDEVRVIMRLLLAQSILSPPTNSPSFTLIERMRT